MRMLGVLLVSAVAVQVPTVDVSPKRFTAPVSVDADDPAIWVHPTHAERSLIIGTDKSKAPAGGLYVFDLDGREVQGIKNLDQPNNVDVEYGLQMGHLRRDIVVATERLQRRLRVFAVDPERRKLIDVSGKTGVFVGEPGERGAPMGISLYRRSSDGVIFAFVSRKESPTNGALAIYRLQHDGRGKVDLHFVRFTGNCVEGNEIEAIFVDDERGWVYYAEEQRGVHKWSADPKTAQRELALLATEPYEGDREGIAAWGNWIVFTDQIEGRTKFNVHQRGAPHNRVATFLTGLDSTDGIEICSKPLGSKWPKGLFVAMNSKDRNFAMICGSVFEGLKQAHTRFLGFPVAILGYSVYPA